MRTAFDSSHSPVLSSRRAFLRTAGMLSGTALLLRHAPAGVVHAFQGNSPDAMRNQIGAAPIETLKLTDRLVMLSGPGGNVIVFHGPDGKVVVDGFVKPAWPKLKAALDGDRRRADQVDDRHALAFRSRRQQRELPRGGGGRDRAREHHASA